MLPAAQLNDLRLAHGSCRRDDGPGRDAMAILDDLLRDHNADPSQRIQQLWLTGDQIYANSAAPELMEDLTNVGKQLIAGNGPGGEFVTLTDPATNTEYTYPLDGYHFPAGRRLMLMNRVGGFTAEGNTAHSIGFGEFASMYLAAWHTNVWPDLLPKLQNRRTVARNYMYAMDTIDVLAQQVIQYAESQGVSPLIDYEGLPENPRDYYLGWMLTPSNARSIDANLTQADLVEQWDDRDSDDGNWARFWMQGPPQLPLRAIWEPFLTFKPEPAPAAGSVAALRFLARSLTPSWWAGKVTFGITCEWRPAAGPSKLIGDKVRDRLHRLKSFLDDVPRVRRALANVATYMIFDDHEVCEDWNITAGWVTRVRSNDLGRKVLRNGMAAYTVFQGWGNDPRAYATSGTPQAAAMEDVIATLLDANGNAHTAPPLAAEAALDLRFANQPLSEAPSSEATRMRWNYRYEAPGLEVIALDSRTERSYEPEADPQIGQPFTSHANAPLVTDESMDRQIPPTPPPGIGADGICLVIAAAPVIGFPPEESVVLPLLQFMDMKTPLDSGRWEQYRKATHFGRLTQDPEHWAMVPRTFERVLARLSSRRRVVFLSGDVHYACSHVMTYWRRVDTDYVTSRFVQLTSSGFRNEAAMAEYLTLEIAQMLQRAFSIPIERLGWHQEIGLDPIEPPASGPITHFNRRIEFLLQNDPIVLPPRALPPGSQQLRPPAWAYRREILEDLRDDLDRLPGLLPPPLLPSTDGVGTMAQSVATRVRWQGEHAPGRRWIPRSNVGIVTFHGLLDAPMLRHSLYTFDLSDPQSPGRPYIVVDAPLLAGPSEMPPSVGTLP